MSKGVQCRCLDGVATITLDAPETRNALSAAMIADLGDAFRQAEEDDETRCVVLASSHPKVWCSGGDLKAFQARSALVQKHEDSANIMSLFKLVLELRKPTLAAIAGQALAGGLGLASCCDLIIASEQAVFGTPEINIGAFPFMVTALAMRDLPRHKANELLLLGTSFGAAELLAMGLVNKVVPARELDAAVSDWARALAEKSPLIMRMGKAAMARQRDMALADALDYLRGQLSLAQSTDDLHEGVAAFFEKRAPKWSGR